MIIFQSRPQDKNQVFTFLGYLLSWPTVLQSLLKRGTDVNRTRGYILRWSYIYSNDLYIGIAISHPSRPLVKHCPRKRSKIGEHLEKVIVVVTLIVIFRSGIVIIFPWISTIVLCTRSVKDWWKTE